MKDIQPEPNFVSAVNLPLNKLMNAIWLFSVWIWGVAIAGATFKAFADQHFSSVEIAQILTAFLIFVSWLHFKPIESIEPLNPEQILPRLHDHSSNLSLQKNDLYSYAAEARMAELQNYHMISQEYVFPFPYICQIYHLLNLKHLEDVHNFSLNNLKIVRVNEFQSTKIGGMLRFETVLESPFNTLRVWRQPIVEVDLILHTPYTVELNIPAYNDKRIVVMFNVLPLGDTDHKLSIDIYSNLEWPKPILQVILHFAACLTVFEDFPYLRKLAQRNLDRVLSMGKLPSHETMLLFRRFAELYAAGV